MKTVAAREIPVGGQFYGPCDSWVYTRVLPVHFPFPSLAEWDSIPYASGLSREHVYAVNTKHQLIAVHPNNQVEPFNQLKETFIECSHCNLLVWQGTMSETAGIGVPGNHESVMCEGEALSSENPVCPGSEMLGYIVQE